MSVVSGDSLRTLIANLVQGISDAVRLEAHLIAFRAAPGPLAVGQRVFICDYEELGRIERIDHDGIAVRMPPSRWCPSDPPCVMIYTASEADEQLRSAE